MLDKIKDIYNKLSKNKYVGKVIDKPWKIAIIVIVILGIFILLGSYDENKITALKGIEYLEDEGFKCKEDHNASESYTCTLKEDKLKHEVSISSYNSVYVYYSVEDDGDHIFSIEEQAFEPVYNSFYGYSYVIEGFGNNCKYVAKNWDKDSEAYIDDKAEVISLDDDCYSDEDDKNTCGACYDYQDTVNKAIDTYRELYEEMDLDLFSEEDR